MIFARSLPVVLTLIATLLHAQTQPVPFDVPTAPELSLGIEEKPNSVAEDEQLFFYGYLQSLLYLQRQHYLVHVENLLGSTVAEPVEYNGSNSTFTLQQLNLFLHKPFAQRYSAFIDFEAQASYSSEKNWGAFNLQEAWIDYTYSDQLGLKLGLLLPVFNNLNEIQNRLPLFPYLARPAVYEVLLSGIYTFEDFRPEQAFAQLSGYAPVGRFRLEYALHLGNNEQSYITTAAPGSGMGPSGGAITIFRGEDVGLFKAVGGRVGTTLDDESLKVGLSSTYDHDRRTEPSGGMLGNVPGTQLPALGNVPRVRLGADLSFHLGSFSFESEYIRVMHELQTGGIDLTRQFAYFNLTWYPTITWFLYAGINYLNSHAYDHLVSDPTPDRVGQYLFIGGTGYRLAPTLTAKFQYLHFRTGENTYVDIRCNYFMTGLSLMF